MRSKHVLFEPPDLRRRNRVSVETDLLSPQGICTVAYRPRSASRLPCLNRRHMIGTEFQQTGSAERPWRKAIGTRQMGLRPAHLCRGGVRRVEAAALSVGEGSSRKVCWVPPPGPGLESGLTREREHPRRRRVPGGALGKDRLMGRASRRNARSLRWGP